MQNDINKPLCDHCGQTLEHFLNQMEEHNLEVVCPSCGKKLGSVHNGQADGSDGNHRAQNPPLKPTGSNDSSARQKKH